jgi:hypothetical protein
MALRAVAFAAPAQAVGIGVARRGGALIARLAVVGLALVAAVAAMALARHRHRSLVSDPTLSRSEGSLGTVGSRPAARSGLSSPLKGRCNFWPPAGAERPFVLAERRIDLAALARVVLAPVLVTICHVRLLRPINA